MGRVTSSLVFDAGRSDDNLDILVALSRYYGRLPGFVIAGGGNTSVKEGQMLLVKASGAPLASITRDGFVALDRARLQALSQTELSSDPATREAQFKEAILQARLEPQKGQRPSVESLLHHLLPGKFVVHSHATIVNTLTCSVHGERLARTLFGDEALWIPFVDPGYVLARTFVRLLAARRLPPKIVLLANHGLIVVGDTPEEIRGVTEHVIARIRSQLGENWQDNAFGAPAPAHDPALVDVLTPALRTLLADSDRSKIITFDNSPLAMSFVSTDAAGTLPFRGPLNPDQIVYCNSFPLYIKLAPGDAAGALSDRLRQAIARHTRTTGFPPRIILARNLGLFAAGDDAKSAATARDLYKDAIEILAGATRLGGPTFMTPGQREFIEQWEVEAYRKQVAAGQNAGAGPVPSQ